MRSSGGYVPEDFEGLLEVEPYGLAPGLGEARPVLIFKSVERSVSFAVPLSPLDAGISVAQSHGAGSSNSPHGLSLKIVEKLDFEVGFCLIKRVRGHHVFVEVHLKSVDEEGCSWKLEARADEALSFCLQAGASFFVERDSVADLRELEMNSQMMDQPPVKSFGRSSRKLRYLM